MLTNGGHEVIGDGNHSPSNIARMVKLQPQIVCVDIGEPDQTGLALLDTLHTQIPPKALVFLVSAKIDAEIIQAAQAVWRSWLYREAIQCGRGANVDS